MQRIPPQSGQESVWDYPRPPKLEPTSRQIQIVFNAQLIVNSSRAWRVLETSHPPVFYIPPTDIEPNVLVPAAGQSWCEWKGHATYFDVVVHGKHAPKAAWAYPEPTKTFQPIAGYVAFYAGPMDSVTVDGEQVTPQPGQFYGGWITSEIVGPFKGSPGTQGW